MFFKYPATVLLCVVALLCVHNVASTGTRRVLVTGASGYMGQFILDAFKEPNSGFQVLGTFSTRSDGCSETEWGCKHMDLTDPDSFGPIVTTFVPDVVINLAAISSPFVCESKPDEAKAVNVPRAFVEELFIANKDVVFIQLSTDQVYPGVSGPYDAANQTHPRPINVYGATKLEFENILQLLIPNHYILRSSMVIGPPTRRECNKQSFIQVLQKQLFPKDAPPMSLFTDEYRCPIHIDDVVKVLLFLAREQPKLSLAERTMNMGGPQSMSRAEIGALVARAAMRDVRDAIVGTKSVDTPATERGFASPADNTLDSLPLQTVTGVTFQTLESTLPRILNLPGGKFPLVGEDDEANPERSRGAASITGEL